jgi:hypothetical protein
MLAGRVANLAKRRRQRRHHRTKLAWWSERDLPGSAP